MTTCFSPRLIRVDMAGLAVLVILCFCTTWWHRAIRGWERCYSMGTLAGTAGSDTS